TVPPSAALIARWARYPRCCPGSHRLNASGTRTSTAGTAVVTKPGGGSNFCANCVSVSSAAGPVLCVVDDGVGVMVSTVCSGYDSIGHHEQGRAAPDKGCGPLTCGALNAPSRAPQVDARTRPQPRPRGCERATEPEPVRVRVRERGPLTCSALNTPSRAPQIDART